MDNSEASPGPSPDSGVHPATASPDDASLGLPIPMNEVSVDTALLPAPVIPRKFDPDFYFRSVFVVFEVGRCLFRVPSHIFVESQSHYFIGLFRPHTSNNPKIVSAPIVLPAEILKEDFRNLLKALYPVSITTKLSLSESEWISVLKLSTKWSFVNLRAIAISELESLQSLTSLNKIIFGRQCYISSWLQSGLAEIVDRTETLSNQDAITMGYTTAIELFRLRELNIENRYNNSRYRGYYNSAPINSMEAIRSTFEAELLAVKRAEVQKSKANLVHENFGKKKRKSQPAREALS